MSDQSNANTASNSFGTPPDREKSRDAFTKLCETIAHLRSPEGCPWDREQTLKSIKPFTLEETYELLEAIDSGVDADIVEELGDVLLQVVLDAQIGDDERRFNIIDVMECVTEKMIRRHPHVFGEVEIDSADEVTHTWQAIKQKEKPRRESILDGLPKELPALAKAARIQQKAARVGYDFPHRNMLFEKLEEELDELTAELFAEEEFVKVPLDVAAPHTPDEGIVDEERRDRVEAELGDVLFVLANIARRWKVNPEEALRRSNAKFRKRFQAIERGLKAAGKEWTETTLVEMEELYQAEKQRERTERSAP